MNPSPQPPTGLDVEDRARLAVDPATVADDAELVALVRGAADALPEVEADALDLHLRHGLTAAELGADTGATPDVTARMLEHTMSRLDDAVGARILFRRGRPRCTVLRDLLGREGVASFGRAATEVIGAHRRRCADCTRESRTRLAAGALFAAVPVAAAPAALKAEVAVALATHGVPMGGSAATTASTGKASGHADGGWYGIVPRAPRPVPMPPRPPAPPAPATIEIAVAVPAAPLPAAALTAMPVAAPAPEAPPWCDAQVVDLADRRQQRRRPRRWPKALLAAAASVILLTGAVAVAANRERPLGDGVAAPETTATPAPDPQHEVVGPGSTPDPGPGGDVPEEEPDAPGREQGRSPGPDGSGGGGAGNPGRGPAGKESAARPALVSFKISDGSATSGTALGSMPKLTWEVKGPGTVKVRGAGVTSASMKGSETVCPGKVSGGRCWCDGSYEYTITVFDADGRVVETDSMSLTMEPAPGAEGGTGAPAGSGAGSGGYSDGSD